MYIFAPGLAIEKRTRLIAGINVVGSVLNIALNYVLIPYMGILGAAVATAVSGLVIFLLTMQQSQKMYNVPHNWLKIAASTVIFGGLFAAAYVVTGPVTSLDPGTIAWKVGALIGSSVVFLLLLGEKQEFKSVLTLFRRTGSRS
jgi:O-antigen/teichoic acid export membrane protein